MTTPARRSLWVIAAVVLLAVGFVAVTARGSAVGPRPLIDGASATSPAERIGVDEPSAPPASLSPTSFPGAVVAVEHIVEG